MEVAVIIVNWNGRKYLKECFESLSEQSHGKNKIFFIDNSSSDGSVEFVRNNYRETEIIELQKNTGFCLANNIGIAKALKNEKINYVIVLNNDTKLNEKYIEELLRCANSHPEAGSIQPKILNKDNPEKIDCSGLVIADDGTAHNRGYGEIDNQKFEKTEEIFGANATASLFTREALEKTRIGEAEFFDNDFFAYYEDVDLAWRLRFAGFASYFCPRAVVHHVGSGTGGKASLLKAYYLHRNHLLNLLKNYPLRMLISAIVWRIWNNMIVFMGFATGNNKQFQASRSYSKCEVAVFILRAWGSAFANSPKFIKKRIFTRREKIIDNSESKLWLKRFSANS